MADWIKTDEAGVYRHETIDGKFRIDTTATNPNGERKRKRRTITGATKGLAVDIRDQIKAEIRTPDELEPEIDRLADFAGRWARDKIKSGDWGKRSEATNIQIIEDHILPAIGDVPLTDLDRSHIRQWTDYIEGKTHQHNGELVPYSHASLRRYWETMTQLCKALFAEGYFDDRFRTWFETYRGPSSDRSGVREDQTLTRGQLATYLSEAEEMYPRWYPEILTLARTGMRRGEMFGLDWQYVDFDAEIIRVVHSWNGPRDGEEGELKKPKTESSNRTIPMAPGLPEVLLDHRKRLFEAQNPGLQQGIVFPSSTGARRTDGTVAKKMVRVGEACGLDFRVGPQVMRKTFITHLVNAGVPPEVINSMTGHSTPEMREHYTNVQPEDQHAALGRLYA